jgi:hypothetical protein
MPVTWTIVGEAGKALDATSRTLEQLGIDYANLKFNSLQSDELSLSISPQSLSSAIIPDLKQKVILYRNDGSGAQRFFTGHVTNVRSIIDSGSEVCNITISGPWWWMERINFTSQIPTATPGVNAERMTAVFGDDIKGADLRISLLSAITRSAALGVPMYSPVIPYPNAPGKFYILGEVKCVRIQSDSKIVCAGSFTNANQTSVNKMVRFNTDGSIDTSFSSSVTSDIETFQIDSSGNFHIGLVAGGYRKISSTGSAIYSTATTGQVLDIKIQSDGKILLGGKFTAVASVAKFGIARLNSDSTLDTSFTGPAFSTATNKWVRSIALSSTGQIYIGGDFYVASTQRCILRLLSTGGIDTSFQTKNVTKALGLGKYNLVGSTTYNQNPYVAKVLIQNDGNIVVSGGFTAVVGKIHCIARFSNAGVLDVAFGSSVPHTIDSLAVIENSTNPTARLFYAYSSLSTSTVSKITNFGTYDKTSIGNYRATALIDSPNDTIYGCRTGDSSSSGLVEIYNDVQNIYSPDYSTSGIAQFFQVPRITLNQSTCAEIISELVRLCPDTMVYFDYSNELPRCIITRRGVCDTTNITVGSSPVTNIDLSPIVELKVSEVKLPYLTRNQDGTKTYNSQTSGFAINGETQIITVSGAELDTFLPKDTLNSFTATDTTTDFNKYLIENDSFTSGVLSKYGIGVSSQMNVGGYYSGYTSIEYRSNAGFYGTYSGTFGAYSYSSITATSANGTNLPISGTITKNNSLPSWASSQGLSIKPITLKGVLTHQFTTKYYKFNRGGSSEYAFYQAPAWITDNASSFQFSKEFYSGYDPQFGYYTYQVASREISCTAYLISGIAAGATVYQNADYSFAFPPEGLASNLLAAQNWLPYEGSIQLVQQDVGATRYRGTKINVIGSLPSLISIGALVQSESIDIANGTTLVSVGCAPRNDYRTFVSKIRKTSQDNIIYIK